jgi:dGTPase
VNTRKQVTLDDRDEEKQKMMEWKKLLNSERPRQSTSTGDHREEFERDYDRAVFSSPVKRLQDKAQVFPLEPHDSVRTRLTHSLEVSSVARGLVRKVCSILPGKFEPNQDRQIEAIAATCGLIHDLGNPPFGHSGEDAIREWFRKSFKENDLIERLGKRDDLAQDFLKFEGNAQTLRIVAKLQVLADYNGLNLTYGTLSALCKYTASSKEAGFGDNHAHSKPGYFTSEADLIHTMREKTGTRDARNPITFLIEAADDIVYSVADIEDGIKKKILKWKELEHLLNLPCGGAKETVEKVIGVKKTILSPSKNPDELPDDIHATAFRTASISILVNSAAEAFKNNYESIMMGTFHGELVTANNTNDYMEVLKSIGRKHVYCTPANLKLELLGRKVIHDLLTLFWEGASQLDTECTIKPKNFSGKLQALLSDAYRKVFQEFSKTKTELPIDYYRLQLVTDYVCGMTDTFAKRLHAELCNG